MLFDEDPNFVAENALLLSLAISYAVPNNIFPRKNESIHIETLDIFFHSMLRKPFFLN